jgi:hypothetical protein
MTARTSDSKSWTGIVVPAGVTAPRVPSGLVTRHGGATPDVRSRIGQCDDAEIWPIGRYVESLCSVEGTTPPSARCGTWSATMTTERPTSPPGTRT